MIETSILIPTKNGARDFGACLEGIYSQKGVGPFEVVVIDSGSTDDTLESARRYPIRIEQIPPERFHHARTRNFAAGLAKGEFLVFLSQDAIPAIDTWLAAMLGNFRDNTVGAVYGRQVPKPGSTVERQCALNALYGDERLVKEPVTRDKLGYRYYLFSDANSAIRTEVWRTTRFPEELKVFEDIGIAKRILDGGWKIVYEPQACVYHSHNHTTSDLFKRYFDLGVTFRRLEIWNAQMRSSLLHEILRIVWRKLARSGGNGTSQKLRASVLQDFAKSVGLLLGLSEHYLPLTFKRHLSAYQAFE
jgi:rhamnosyltransferase